jgi:hypothetical protein
VSEIRPAPVIIVGTGRCGSTLLSQVMRAHEQVLSVSELFSFVTDLGSMISQTFPNKPVTGAELWSQLAGRHPRENLLLQHGLRMQEVLYPPVGAPLPAEGVPALMLTTLPHLSEQPWVLFDALAREFAERGPACAGDHYRAMFELLCGWLGRRTWVERSGGTLRIIARLLDTFPEARVVHVVRDGRNTALSMSRHIGFRMALICFQLLELLGVDPFEDDDRSEIDDLSDELIALLPEHFDVDGFWAYDISPSLCGHYWSGEIRDGLDTLATLAPERLLTLRYEQLLAAPTDTLTRLGEFLGLGPPDPDWIARAAAMVGHGRSDWKQQPVRERDELTSACAPGFAALARWGIIYGDEDE